MDQKTQRYIVLPSYGFTGPALKAGKLGGPGGVRRLDARPGLSPGDAGRDEAATTVKVLDEISDDGPKLVEMTPEAELNLRAEIPGLKIVPIVTYEKMRFAPEVASAAASAGPADGPARIVLTVVDKKTGAALPGATVIAFTDYRDRVGDDGVTDAGGTVTLRIRPGSTIDRLYVYGPARYWGHFASNVAIGEQHTVRIAPIDLAAPGLLQDFYGDAPPDAGSGIRVGIIDSGVAKRHPALPNVSGGANLVLEEIKSGHATRDDWGPAKKDGAHGTHVAGIVGARPNDAYSLGGVAPGVELRSYRVFPNAGGGATNYDIMKAIDLAVSDGCQVINLSLGGGPSDEGVRAAIGKASDAGTLVVAAAGNDGRRPVSFPARLDICLAVAAMGRKSMVVTDSSETGDIDSPYGTDEEAFVAAFSNCGPQIDVVGPGVGIISTLPDDTFGVMSGTSMACPAVAGFAARLLAADPALRGGPDVDRVSRLKAKLFALARPQGFGRDYEGAGLPLDAAAIAVAGAPAAVIGSAGAGGPATAAEITVAGGPAGPEVG